MSSLLRTTLAAALAFVLAACTSTSPETATGSRVGSYDSRAVAIAYYQSDAFADRLRSLRESGAPDAEGVAMQEHMHRQGFGTAPVDDILDTVRPELPAVLEQAGVDELVSKWDSRDGGDSAATVDVTDRLVELFDPDASTLRTVAQIRAKDPIPESELNGHD